eukprot:365953-Chlamydomonas_euryale.AAC.5
MQHNPYEIGQPWRPPGGLYRAMQYASRFFCPPLRSHKATDFRQLLKGSIELPDLLLVAAAAAAPDGRSHLRRNIGNAPDALACGWVECLDAFRPARHAKFCYLEACAPAAQARALNDRFGLRRMLNKRVRGPLVWARQAGDGPASDRSPGEL